MSWTWGSHLWCPLPQDAVHRGIKRPNATIVITRRHGNGCLGRLRGRWSVESAIDQRGHSWGCHGRCVKRERRYSQGKWPWREGLRRRYKAAAPWQHRGGNMCRHMIRLWDGYWDTVLIWCRRNTKTAAMSHLWPGATPGVTLVSLQSLTVTEPQKHVRHVLLCLELSLSHTRSCLCLIALSLAHICVRVCVSVSERVSSSISLCLSVTFSQTHTYVSISLSYNLFMHEFTHRTSKRALTLSSCRKDAMPMACSPMSTVAGGWWDDTDAVVRVNTRAGREGTRMLLLIDLANKGRGKSKLVNAGPATLSESSTLTPEPLNPPRGKRGLYMTPGGKLYTLVHCDVVLRKASSSSAGIALKKSRDGVGTGAGRVSSSDRLGEAVLSARDRASLTTACVSPQNNNGNAICMQIFVGRQSGIVQVWLRNEQKSFLVVGLIVVSYENFRSYLHLLWGRPKKRHFRKHVCLVFMQ